MRRTALVLVSVLAFALPAATEAKSRTIAPPGNSGVSQYVETVPTAGGGRPSSTLHVGSGTPGRGGSVPQATQRSLAALGRNGRAASALAQAGAPATKRTSATSSRARGKGGSVGAAIRSNGSSPFTAVLRALGGSTSSGGLGPLLPIILIISLLAGGAIARLRGRRAT